MLPNSEEHVTFRLAEKLRLGLSNQQFGGGHPFSITASLGVTTLLPSEKFESAVKRADVALYKAKSQVRNRVVIAELK